MFDIRDMTKFMNEAYEKFAAFEPATGREFFRTFGEINERFARIGLKAAEETVDVTAKWARANIRLAGKLATVPEKPVEYVKLVNEVISEEVDIASENVALLAEQARKAQMEAVEVMLEAGKAVREEAVKATEKAAAEVTEVASKAARTAKPAKTASKAA